MRPNPLLRNSNLLDVLLAAATGAVVAQTEWTAGAARPIAIAGVSFAAILVRRRWPVPALLAAAVLGLATVVLKTPSAGLGLVLCIQMYAVARYPARPRPWPFAIAIAVVLFGAGMLVDPAGWWRLDSLGLFALIFGGAAAGDSTRNRRAYIAEVTERARQAEQTREDEARRRVMDERLRIARELHDVVAHHIAVINVQAGAAGHVLRKNPEQVWPVLEHIRQASDTVLREIRSVVGVLREPGEADSTEPSPGLDRVPDLVANLAAAGFAVTARTEGEPRPLPAIADLAAYRIVQEALTNAHRHGDGPADLAIAWGEGAVTITVLNRSAKPPSTQGFGLIGMRERAAAAHGTVTTGPAEDGRFRVRASLPYTEGTP